jgi:predicted PurR-regulated permease PerM
MAHVTDGALFRRTLVVAAAIGFAVVVWRLTDLIMLLLAASLVAFIFYKIAERVERWTRLPFPFALTIAVVVPTLFLLGVFWAFGSMMASQFAILFDQIPDAVATLEDWARNTPVGRDIVANARNYLPDGSRIVGVLQTILGNIGTVVTTFVVVLVAGIYLGAQPRLYGVGILKLVPPHARARTVATTRAVAEAISAWLKAQGVSMAFVGVFTGIALAIVGVPGAPAIGLVAGICEFVPYLGTIVVAIPSIILGFTISPETGIWTIVALVVVQQVQGNIVTPLVQSRMSELPPALTIFSLIAAGVLLGPMGVILAVPLTVIGLTLVKELVTHRPTPPTDTSAVLLPEEPRPAPREVVS